MNIYYAREGKLVAVVAGATHVPRKGELVFLTLGEAGPDVFEVLQVAWDTRPNKGEGAEPKQHSEANVFIILGPRKD